jgi:hypothetical protein
MASNSIDFLKVILRGTLQWPRLNQTYRYNPAIKKSEACAPTAMGASWSVSVEMPKAQAKEIYDQAVAHYNACRQRNTTLPKFETVFGMSKNDETGTVTFATKRNGVRRDGTANAAPVVIDGQKEPLANLAIWGGSKGVVRVYAAPVVDPNGKGGISLLLDTCQVTEAVYGGNGLDDFDTVESNDDPFETKALDEQKRQSIKEELSDDIPW